MPYPENQEPTSDLNALDYSDDKGRYPDQVDLTPGSERHEIVMKAVLDRARKSYDEMLKKFPAWKAIDEQLRIYIPTDLTEDAIKARDSRKPVSIVIPMMFWNLETLMGVWNSAFLGDYPYFGYAPTGPEDTVNVAQLEKVIEAQSRRYSHALDLDVVHRDGLSYGISAATPVWMRELGQKTKRKATTITDIEGRTVPGPFEKYIDYNIVNEGHDIQAIDPYKYLPDPDRPAHRFRDKKYDGFQADTDRYALMDMEKNNTEAVKLFNVKAIQYTRYSTGTINEDDSGRYTKEGGVESREPADTADVSVIWMYIRIIPSEWKLGDATQPQIWLFAVANAKVLIAAQPAGHDHRMIPIATNAPDFDGHTAMSLSRMEVAFGLQHYGNFLANTEMTWQRKGLGGSYVMDPDKLEVHNFKDQYGYGIAKVFMLTRPNYGGSLKDTIMPLPVDHFAQENMNKVGAIADLMHESTGAQDAMRGKMREGPDRVTGDEARATRMQGFSRLVVPLKHTQEMFYFPLGRMIASQTQQYMSPEVFEKYLGRWKEDLAEEYGVSGSEVDPMAMNADFDMVSSDSSAMNPDYFPMAMQALNIAIASAQDPELAEVDRKRLFKHVLRTGGFNNVNDFFKRGGQASIDTPESIDARVQSGEIAPAGEVLNANRPTAV